MGKVDDLCKEICGDDGQLRFTMDEWERFFDWLGRKYGMDEEAFHGQDGEFCESLMVEWKSIAESYGYTFEVALHKAKLRIEQSNAVRGASVLKDDYDLV